VNFDFSFGFLRIQLVPERFVKVGGCTFLTRKHCVKNPSIRLYGVCNFQEKLSSFTGELGYANRATPASKR
jgi:hypothetical protein